jgi:hypothetical protein
VTLTLPPAGSVFVVFGKAAADAKASDTYVDRTAASPALALAGPWTLVFNGVFGTPASIPLDGLKSWTESDVAAVKYFSGLATYETSFEVPAGAIAGARRLVLDLGEVKETARVSLNGREVGTVWTPPYRVDITGAVAPGTNALRVEVANLLANRIIGDLAAPAAGTYMRSNVITGPRAPLTAASPLHPSGLIGPVRIFKD